MEAEFVGIESIVNIPFSFAMELNTHMESVEYTEIDAKGIGSFCESTIEPI